MGKRKLDIRFVEDKQDRMVKFCKRRQGLFKKAQDLSTLCGVDIAVITFSATGRSFVFGSPDPETIIGRYLSSTAAASSSPPVPLPLQMIYQPQEEEGGSRELENLLTYKKALDSVRERVLARLNEISSRSCSSVLSSVGSAADAGLGRGYEYGCGSALKDPSSSVGSAGAALGRGYDECGYGFGLEDPLSSVGSAGAGLRRGYDECGYRSDLKDPSSSVGSAGAGLGRGYDEYGYGSGLEDLSGAGLGHEYDGYGYGSGLEDLSCAGLERDYAGCGYGSGLEVLSGAGLERKYDGCGYGPVLDGLSGAGLGREYDEYGHRSGLEDLPAPATATVSSFSQQQPLGLDNEDGTIFNSYVDGATTSCDFDAIFYF